MTKAKGIWRYIPHFREIDEEAIERKLIAEGVISSTAPTQENADNEWEVLDEANRPWWKFFDEYEYRLKKKPRSNDKWYHWFAESDTPAERKLLIKLDILLCAFSFVMYWVKYLDQTNLNNAYVSGMKESLGLQGNDLVNTQAVYTVGSVVFQIPFMYLIHKYPTNYMLPLMDLGWGIFTLAIYKAQNRSQLQAFRFFVGVFESAFYPTINYLFACWYKPREFARRGGIYYWGQMLGVMTAGLLQGAAYQNLNNLHGLEGWRWMFIIDAIITIPVGIIGIFSLPGVPGKCYSLFLTDEEIFLARKRLRDINISIDDESESFFTLKLWKEMLSDWKIYMFTLINVLGWNNSNASPGTYILWLKSLKRFSVVKVNQLSTITPALGILWILITCSIADLFQTRVGAIIFSQVFNCTGNIILAVWNVPEGAKWFAFMLQYFGWAMISVVFGWMADSTRSTPQQRAIITISLNMFGQASTAFTSVLVWKTVEAPRFLKGFSFTATSAFCIIPVSLIILYLYKRDERSRAAENGILLYNSALGDEIPNGSEQNKGEKTALSSEDDSDKN